MSDAPRDPTPEEVAAAAEAPGEGDDVAPTDAGGPLGLPVDGAEWELVDEPPATALDPAVAAMVEQMSGDQTVPWRALLAETEALLADAGIEAPAREARWIVEEATGLTAAELITELDTPATVNGVAALDRMVERRRAGEPLQHVLGRWAFRGLDLMVDARVLIPRPETEGLVDHVLAEIDRVAAEAVEEVGGAAPAPVVVDLGCGSGAIGLAVAAERRSAAVHLVDVSSDAVAVARANLAGLGVAGSLVQIHEGSWFDPLPDDLRGAVTVLASNPPYVAADEALPPEVADWEPALALISGPTGLEAIEVILTAAAEWLVPGGAVVIEIGETQGAAAAERARAAGLTDVEVRADLAGRDRVVVARRPRDPVSDLGHEA